MDLTPGFKNSAVGVIPEDWGDQALAQLEPFITSGSRGWAKHYSDRGDLFVRITNLSRERIYLDLSDTKYVDVPPDDAEATRTALQQGDLLISITADIGMIGYVDEVIPLPAYINQHIACVRIGEGAADPKFVAYFLASDAAQERFRSITDVGAKTGINLTTVGNIRTAVPPLREQQAIAEALSDIDASIAAQSRLIAKKRDLQQGVTQSLLIGEIRLGSFARKNARYKTTEIGPIPEGWDVVPMGDLFGFKNGLNKAKRYFGYGTPIVNFMDVFGCPRLKSENIAGRVDVTRAEREAYAVCKGDVFFTRTSETVEQIGMAAAMLDSVSDAVYSGFVLRGRPKDDSLDDQFKAWCFSATYFRKQIMATASYTTRALTNGGALSAALLARPPLPEQKAIAATLDDFDSEISLLEARLEKTRALKQAMMQALLTGRVRLPIARNETSNVKEAAYG